MSPALRKTLDHCIQEVTFEYSRSPGPGGQHVNKVATQATLCFDVDRSPSLTPSQRRRIREILGGRVARDGTLRVRSRKHRSQSANRAAALRRFEELLRETLTPPKTRKPTKPSRASVRRRLEDKKHRGRIKQLRRGEQ